MNSVLTKIALQSKYSLKNNKKKFIGITLGLLVVLGIVYSVQAKKNAPAELTVATVEQKNLVQSVNETGTVEANIKLEYGFEKSGRVVALHKKVGDEVKKGDLIASIDGVSERSNLAQSVALLRSAQAALDLRFAGPTSQNLQSAKASVEKARAGVMDAEANITKTELANVSSLQQAERALETAQNNLRSVQGGENSKIVNDAYEDLVNSLKSAVTKLNDGLIESDTILGLDNKFANDVYEDMLGKLDSSAIEIAEGSYLTAKRQIAFVESKIVGLTALSSHDSIDAAAHYMDNAILTLEKNLSDVKNVLNFTNSGNNLTQTTLSGLKTSILTAQSSLNATRIDISTSEQAVSSSRNSLTTYTIAYEKAKQDFENTKKQIEVQKSLALSNVVSAKALLSQAEASLDSLTATPREVDIASLRAEVSRNQASVMNAQNEYNKTELKALTDGVISKFDTEVGETVSPSLPIVTILSNGLAVKVDISESEISKVKVQNKVTLTLDALGEDVPFSGIVSAIEPGETKVSGVVYYKTTVVLDTNQARIAEVRPGMTANVSITTDTRENILVIPGRAVLEKEGTKIVRVVTEKKKGKFEERTVTVGMKGNNGELEILSGLSKGQEVVTYVKTK